MLTVPTMVELNNALVTEDSDISERAHFMRDASDSLAAYRQELAKGEPNAIALGQKGYGLLFSMAELVACDPKFTELQDKIRGELYSSTPAISTLNVTERSPIQSPKLQIS